MRMTTTKTRVMRKKRKNRNEAGETRILFASCVLADAADTSLRTGADSDLVFPQWFKGSGDDSRVDRDRAEEDQDAGDVSEGVDEDELDSDELDTDRVTSIETLAAAMHGRAVLGRDSAGQPGM